MSAQELAEKNKAKIAESMRFEIYERAHQYRTRKLPSMGGYTVDGEINPFDLNYDENKQLKINKE